MPSPIAHIGVGYVLYRLTRAHAPSPALVQVRQWWPVGLLVAVGFSLAPDLDVLAGVVLGDFSRFHNQATHSMIAGLAISGLFAALMYGRFQTGGRYWLGLALAGYTLHVLMDSATIGRGVLAFWPFSLERFQFPLTLFYGVRWSDGLLSSSHVVTVITELGFVALLALLTHLGARFSVGKGG